MEYARSDQRRFRQECYCWSMVFRSTVPIKVGCPAILVSMTFSRLNRSDELKWLKDQDPFSMDRTRFRGSLTSSRAIRKRMIRRSWISTAELQTELAQA